MLGAAEHDRICEVRERTGWGPRLIASEVGLALATVALAERALGGEASAIQCRASAPIARRKSAGTQDSS